MAKLRYIYVENGPQITGNINVKILWTNVLFVVWLKYHGARTPCTVWRLWQGCSSGRLPFSDIWWSHFIFHKLYCLVSDHISHSMDISSDFIDEPGSFLLVCSLSLLVNGAGTSAAYTAAAWYVNTARNKTARVWRFREKTVWTVQNLKTSPDMKYSWTHTTAATPSPMLFFPRRPETDTYSITRAPINGSPNQINPNVAPKTVCCFSSNVWMSLDPAYSKWKIHPANRHLKTPSTSLEKHQWHQSTGHADRSWWWHGTQLELRGIRAHW